MAYLLFPGRHILQTVFQENYLKEILNNRISQLKTTGNVFLHPEEKIDGVVFAITSANRDNSRYNPVSFHERAIGIDRFWKEIVNGTTSRYFILGIPDYKLTNKFAGYILKEIADQTEHNVVLSPDNTIVLSSTPAVIAQYQELGFTILPAELDIKTKKFHAETPSQILTQCMNDGVDWSKSEMASKLSRSTQSLWTDFPHIYKKIQRLWKDPILTDDGSLTKTRNYSTYATGMGQGPLLEQKYNDIKRPIVEGKIVDEGCADGALLARLSVDFPDSDLIGIDLASEFIARCLERQRAGEFGGSYVHFHQRNITEKIFEDNSIDTTICNSTTHEIWSYGKGESTLRDYLQKKYQQTRAGGRLVIRDVVGPENKDGEVFMYVNDTDGSNDDPYKLIADQAELATYLSRLSTHSRFLRFAKEYLLDMRNSKRRNAKSKIKFKEKIIDGKHYIRTTFKNAVEFMTKKDYTDNWQSELNEEFAFWSFLDWKRELTNAGFTIIENPNDETLSRAYKNPWIIENRLIGKVELYKKNKRKLEPMEYPVTNMVLIGEKSLSL